MLNFLQKFPNQTLALHSNVCSSLYVSALSIHPDIYAVVTFNKQNDSYRLVNILFVYCFLYKIFRVIIGCLNPGCELFLHWSNCINYILIVHFVNNPEFFFF